MPEGESGFLCSSYVRGFSRKYTIKHRRSIVCQHHFSGSCDNNLTAYVSRGFLDRLLSLINLCFDLRWLFVLLLKRTSVSGADSSVSTTQITVTHSWCLYAAAETCTSELNSTRRLTVIVGVFSAPWHHYYEPSAPPADSSRSSLCLLLQECVCEGTSLRCRLWKRMSRPSQVSWRDGWNGGGIWFISSAINDKPW